MRALAIAALLALAPAAYAEPTLISSEVRSPSATATDLVFVSEGFKASEKADYVARVQALVHLLETDQASFVRAHRDRWNVHVVFAPSNEAAPRAGGAPAKDTAFKARNTTDGFLVADSAAIDRAALAAPDVDVVVLVVRFDGPTTALRANADIPPEGARVRIPEDHASAIVHELGHAAFGLGDEYVEKAGAIPASERWTVARLPNLTLDPNGGRFAGIAPPPYFEGGALWEKGVWRCEPDCRMRTSWRTDGPFCAACRAAIEGRPTTSPSVPRIVAPSSATVPACTVARIEPGPGAPPARFIATVQRARWGTTYTEVSRTELEGWKRSFPLTLEAGGRYALGVAASDAAGTSPFAWTFFEATACAPPLAPPPATHASSGAVTISIVGSHVTISNEPTRGIVGGVGPP